MKRLGITESDSAERIHPDTSRRRTASGTALERSARAQSLVMNTDLASRMFFRDHVFDDADKRRCGELGWQTLARAAVDRLEKAGAVI
jgi:hypothetical protein